MKGFLGIILIMMCLVVTSCSSVDDPEQVTDAKGVLMARAEAEDSLGGWRLRLEATDGRDLKMESQGPELKAELPIGTYLLQALCGDDSAEGHGKQLYMAEENFTIYADSLTELRLAAKPQKAQISVEATKAFTGYMNSWEARINKGVYDTQNTKPYCLNPGEAVVTVYYTLPSGESSSIEAARFQAKAGVHYTVTVDVNSGEAGEAKLNITLNDALTTKEIKIEI